MPRHPQQPTTVRGFAALASWQTSSTLGFVARRSKEFPTNFTAVNAELAKYLRRSKSLRRDGEPVGEARRVVATERAVLEKAPALDGLATFRADGAADVVDDAEARPADDRRVRHVVGEALSELVALLHTMH